MADTSLNHAARSHDVLKHAGSFVPVGQFAGKPAMPLTRNVVVVGSGKNSRMLLKSDSVSMTHTLLIHTDAGWYFRDLVSRTHTILNGKSQREAPLRNGDTLTIGAFVFHFVGVGQATPAVPTPPAAMEITDAEIPVPIDTRTVLIGRRVGCEVRLIEESVSLVHAVIFEADGVHYLRDLYSRTGTFLNGKKVHQSPLKFGDIIIVGETTIRYVPDASVDADASLDHASFDHVSLTDALSPNGEAGALDLSGHVVGGPNGLANRVLNGLASDAVEEADSPRPDTARDESRDETGVSSNVSSIVPAPMVSVPLLTLPLADEQPVLPLARRDVFDDGPMQAQTPTETPTEPAVANQPLTAGPIDAEPIAAEPIDVGSIAVESIEVESVKVESVEGLAEFIGASPLEVAPSDLVAVSPPQAELLADEAATVDDVAAVHVEHEEVEAPIEAPIEAAIESPTAVSFVEPEAGLQVVAEPPPAIIIPQDMSELAQLQARIREALTDPTTVLNRPLPGSTDPAAPAPPFELSESARRARAIAQLLEGHEEIEEEAERESNLIPFDAGDVEAAAPTMSAILEPPLMDVAAGEATGDETVGDQTTRDEKLTAAASLAESLPAAAIVVEGRVESPEPDVTPPMPEVATLSLASGASAVAGDETEAAVDSPTVEDATVEEPVLDAAVVEESQPSPQTTEAAESTTGRKSRKPRKPPLIKPIVVPRPAARSRKGPKPAAVPTALAPADVAPLEIAPLEIAPLDVAPLEVIAPEVVAPELTSSDALAPLMAAGKGEPPSASPFDASVDAGTITTHVTAPTASSATPEVAPDAFATTPIGVTGEPLVADEAAPASTTESTIESADHPTSIAEMSPEAVEADRVDAAIISTDALATTSPAPSPAPAFDAAPSTTLEGIAQAAQPEPLAIEDEIVPSRMATQGDELAVVQAEEQGPIEVDVPQAGEFIATQPRTIDEVEIEAVSPAFDPDPGAIAERDALDGLDAVLADDAVEAARSEHEREAPAAEPAIEPSAPEPLADVMETPRVVVVDEDDELVPLEHQTRPLIAADEHLSDEQFDQSDAAAAPQEPATLLPGPSADAVASSPEPATETARDDATESSIDLAPEEPPTVTFVARSEAQAIAAGEPHVFAVDPLRAEQDDLTSLLDDVSPIEGAMPVIEGASLSAASAPVRDEDLLTPAAAATAGHAEVIEQGAPADEPRAMELRLASPDIEAGVEDDVGAVTETDVEAVASPFTVEPAPLDGSTLTTAPRLRLAAYESDEQPAADELATDEAAADGVEKASEVRPPSIEEEIAAPPRAPVPTESISIRSARPTTVMNVNVPSMDELEASFRDAFADALAMAEGASFAKPHEAVVTPAVEAKSPAAGAGVAGKWELDESLLDQLGGDGKLDPLAGAMGGPAAFLSLGGIGWIGDDASDEYESLPGSAAPALFPAGLQPMRGGMTPRRESRRRRPVPADDLPPPIDTSDIPPLDMADEAGVAALPVQSAPLDMAFGQGDDAEVTLERRVIADRRMDEMLPTNETTSDAATEAFEPDAVIPVENILAQEDLVSDDLALDDAAELNDEVVTADEASVRATDDNQSAGNRAADNHFADHDSGNGEGSGEGNGDGNGTALQAVPASLPTRMPPRPARRPRVPGRGQSRAGVDDSLATGASASPFAAQALSLVDTFSQGSQAGLDEVLTKLGVAEGKVRDHPPITHDVPAGSRGIATPFASHVPILTEAGSKPVSPSVRRVRQQLNKLPILLGLMVGLLGVVALAAWYLPFPKDLVAEVAFINLIHLNDPDRKLKQMDIRDWLKDCRQTARAGLDDRFGGGFLDSPELYAAIVEKAHFDKYNPNLFLIEYRSSVNQADSDKARLNALVSAFIKANRPLVDAKRKIDDQIASLERATAQAKDKLALLDAEEAKNTAVYNGAPTSDELRRLERDLATLDAARKAAVQALDERQAELKRVESNPMAFVPSSRLAPEWVIDESALMADVGGALPTTKPAIQAARDWPAELAKLIADRDAAKTRLEQLLQTQTPAARQARESFDASMNAFAAEVEAARKNLGDRPEVLQYVESAGRLQGQIRNMTDTLVRRQQQQLTRLDEFKRQLKELTESTRDQRMNSDPQLKQWGDRLAFAERQLNAAKEANAPAQDVAAIEADVSLLKSMIAGKRETLNDPKASNVTKQLEEMMQVTQREMAADREQNEKLLADVQDAFRRQQPAVEKLPADQKQLSETLAARLAQIDLSRQRYTDSLALSAGGDALKISELQAKLATFEPQIVEARAHVESDGVAQAAEMERRTQAAALIDAARQAVAAAQSACDEAVGKYESKRKAVESVREAVASGARARQRNDDIQAEVGILANENSARIAQAKKLADVRENFTVLPPEKPAEAYALNADRADPRIKYGTAGLIAVLLGFAPLLIREARHRSLVAAATKRDAVVGDAIPSGAHTA